ncbi:MAG TPA: hypothetical protein DHV36_07360 [Desulfobacteraceae bacterium]|nr:hypothetical protein [Desulfobacteraceae bacterium]
MKFSIDKKLPLSIKEQLKRQIRGMIHSKHLRPGDALPSCSDMSAILSVNRNTVAAVYADLSSEGILTSNRGAGTMVSTTTLPEKETTLNAIMNEAFSRAAELGFTNEQITDQFFSALAARKPAPPKTILLVWCNPLTIADVGKTLADRLNVKIRSLLVEEIEQFPGLAKEALSGVDLVVTSINYLAVIQPHADEQGIEVTGIILTPMGKFLNEIARIPKGTTVGFVCVNNMAAKSTCKAVHLSGRVSLNTIWAGADDSPRLKDMVSHCDVIFATHYVYDQVRKLSRKDQKVINLNVSLTDENLEIIRERLEKQ